MPLATTMAMAAALLTGELAAPTGLPVLHSDAAERVQQERFLDRLDDADLTSERPQRRRAPSAADEKRAAAWRADHLTCISRKGRTAAQYEAECRAWLNSRE